jgi:hypothetical protein
MLHILYNEVKMSVGGFFDLSYSLGLNVNNFFGHEFINNNYVCFQFVGSIVIYLIILIQTDPLASKIILTTLNGI